MVGDRYLVVAMGDSDVRPRMVSRVTQTDNTRITTRFGYCRSDIDSLNLMQVWLVDHPTSLDESASLLNALL